MDDDGDLVLASSSPRRREILRRLGVPHRVVAPEIDETRRPGEGAEALVRRVARDKAQAVADELRPEDGPPPWVLAADTTVVVDGEPLGKPADRVEARRMLATLSGRDHQVLTAFCVTRRGGPEACHMESTRVWFRELGEAEIDRYVASGEPMDKAGAYGIQGLGCFLVARIDGNYENVVGLPACAVVETLCRLGVIDRFPLATGGDGP